MGKGAKITTILIGIALIASGLAQIMRATTPKDSANIEETPVEVEVYSDESLTIMYTGTKNKDVNFNIVNNSERSLMIIAEDSYIDDKKQELVMPSISATIIEPGKSASKEVEFYDKPEGDKLEIRFTARGADENAPDYYEILVDTGLIEIPINE